MIRINVHWPSVPSLPSFVQEFDNDLQASNYLYGTNYLSYLVLMVAVWLLLF